MSTSSTADASPHSCSSEADPRSTPKCCAPGARAAAGFRSPSSFSACWRSGRSTAPLSGAIIAQRHAQGELNRKTVQHQEGGIVSQILVRDGERVRAGQPLIVIGDVRNDAELSLLQDQLSAERIRNARAAAEAALAASFQAPATSDTPRARAS